MQAYHWAQTQVTVHPAVAFINEADTNGPFTHKETCVVISDDLKHTAATVASFMKPVNDHLRETYGISHQIQFSDCCAAQYRGKESFADLSFSMQDFGMCTERHYFEASHGKSSADGDSAVVKHAATRAVTNGQVLIRNASGNMG